MRNTSMVVMTGVIISLMLIGPLHAADQPSEQTPARTDEAKMPDGVIGISLHIGAERIGDPASLYVGRVHREGPAHKAGLKHGDELVSVDGVAVSGKTYEQVVKMVGVKWGPRSSWGSSEKVRTAFERFPSHESPATNQ